MGEPRPPPTLTNPDPMKNFPAIFLALLVGTLTFGYMAKGDNEAIARCEYKGGSIDECRLIVLGR
jgi:hypothetical protein